MRYISLFSGIGGLESRKHKPIILCEKNKSCIEYLRSEYKNSEIYDDIKKLTKKNFKLPKVDLVSGGWPCQDISVAGEKKGFNGEHSVLFYDLIKVAKKSKAESIVAENVPNLLTLFDGEIFSSVLNELSSAGYPFISWRIINTREFNIPHQRRRVFIVASKNEQKAKNLFNPIKKQVKKSTKEIEVFGFYHTAGTHSICYSKNFVPTLKVSGSGPAIFYQNTIRRLTPSESLLLQGFKPSKFKGISDTHIYSMTGNAVSKPVGEFIFSSLENDVKEIKATPLNQKEIFGDEYSLPKKYPHNGFFKKNAIYEINLKPANLCSNLSDFIDFKCNDYLSDTAILGLIRRAFKADKKINSNLLDAMISILTINTIDSEIGENNILKLYENKRENKIQSDELIF